MKDKFQYTAEPLIYKCTCCGLQFPGEEDYCPNCEVRLVYTPDISEGEMTYNYIRAKAVEYSEQIVDDYGWRENAKLDFHAGAKWALAKVGSETPLKVGVSEEKIEEIARRIADNDGGGLWGDYYRAAKRGIKAAIKELNKG